MVVSIWAFHTVDSGADRNFKRGEQRTKKFR